MEGGDRRPARCPQDKPRARRLRLTRREAGAILILVLLIVGLLVARGLVGTETRGPFPDRRLEEVIRLAVGKREPHPLSASDCRTLTELDGFSGVGRRHVSDLTGLENCMTLRKLDLADNDIHDISPLSFLTQLTWLDLAHNRISDASPLSSLAKLTRLRLDDNRIEDMLPLSRLPNLTELGFSSNRVPDISPLSSLTKLTRLTLSDNKISDISPLSSLTNLTSLGIGDNNISDISALSSLTNLIDLDLSGNPISDISALVANPSFGKGANIRLYNTKLDRSPGSKASLDILMLRARGVFVQR